MRNSERRRKEFPAYLSTTSDKPPLLCSGPIAFCNMDHCRCVLLRGISLIDLISERSRGHVWCDQPLVALRRTVVIEDD